MMDRRRALASIGSVLVAPATGCLQGTGNAGHSQGTEELPVRFWLKQVTLSESKQNSIDPIVFADLPDAEREIVRTAIENGEYTVESENVSSALEKLRKRIEQRADGGLEVYLRREETYYRVGFADGDHIIAHPTQ